MIGMYFWFFACTIGMIAMVPLHFSSVAHLKLQERYGKKKGTRIAETYGLVSGWGFFSSWIGIWVSPQPRFAVPMYQGLSISVPVISILVPLSHIMVSVPFTILGAWFGIEGVRKTTLKVSETHRTEKVVTTGVYSIVRHPQYLGGLLAHIGISFLLSALYSLVFTPLVVVLVYLISRKEEEELIREFGEEYEDYRRNVPMLIPRLGGCKRLMVLLLAS